jgi:hypothetical protein
MGAPTVRFGDLPVGAKFRLENMWCEKIEPIVIQASRDFYAGVYEFHDWNVRFKFMNHGEVGMMSLAPDTLVVPL